LNTIFKRCVLNDGVGLLVARTGDAELVIAYAQVLFVVAVK
jgi:hypothetical protein